VSPGGTPGSPRGGEARAGAPPPASTPRRGAGGARGLISSTDNARVKELVALRSSRERRRRGLFLAEGPRELERAAAAGLRILETYYAPALTDWPGGQPVSERVLAKLAYRAKPEGVVSLVEAPRFSLPRGGTLYLVAVGLEKPGNLGAIARSAEAAGADALLVADAHADPFNPNAIRASSGAVFTLPVLETSLEEVQGLGVALLAAVVGAGSAHSEADLSRPVAIAVGAEDRGLPARWREAAEGELSIPIRSGASTESLNAAVAAAILLFEAVRQRA
jgi:TrmH family RNA methyltransferase